MFLSKASRFGLYAVVTMASEPDARMSAAEIATRFRISENHVAKVLQLLKRSRIISSFRGLGGGYQLNVDPHELSMLDIVECIEGPMASSCDDCELHTPTGCTAQTAACGVHSVLAELRANAFYTMKSITIATLAGEGTRKLEGVLDLVG